MMKILLFLKPLNSQVFSSLVL